MACCTKQHGVLHEAHAGAARRGTERSAARHGAERSAAQHGAERGAARSGARRGTERSAARHGAERGTGQAFALNVLAFQPLESLARAAFAIDHLPERDP
jgi:hypothetical protein